MILVINAGPIIMDDTDSYHIQMIKWAQEYGTVPGIANLHLRYGFNSSWFISSALLSPAIKGINTYVVLNGLLSAWFCFYLFEKIFDAFSKKITVLFVSVSASSFFVLLFCFFVWPMIRGNAASGNYDFIATCCIVVLFIETVSSPDQDWQQDWLIWPVYLFTVRIINYPILILTILSLIRIYKDRKIKDFVIYSLIILALIIPFIIRNTILSGYPLFPIYQADFFSFDWKADKQQTIDIVNFIKYFNRVNIQNQPLSITMQLQFPGWIKAWYHFLFLYDKILTTISLCCYIIILFIWKRFKQHFHFNARFFFVVMALQLISWFFIAPDPRFVYGPLICGVFSLLFIISSLSTNIGYIISRAVQVSLPLMIIGVLFYTIKKTETADEYRNWITPRSLPVPAVRKIVIDGIELKIPEKVLNNWNPRCYDIELPCLYQFDPRLKARGKTIQAGFRLEK